MVDMFNKNSSFRKKNILHHYGGIGELVVAKHEFSTCFEGESGLNTHDLLTSFNGFAVSCSDPNHSFSTSSTLPQSSLLIHQFKITAMKVHLSYKTLLQGTWTYISTYLYLRKKTTCHIIPLYMGSWDSLKTYVHIVGCHNQGSVPYRDISLYQYFGYTIRNLSYHSFYLNNTSYDTFLLKFRVFWSLKFPNSHEICGDITFSWSKTN